MRRDNRTILLKKTTQINLMLRVKSAVKQQQPPEWWSVQTQVKELQTLTEWVSDPAACSQPYAALLSSSSVSSQPFKASTHSTRSRASRKPEVWTGSTRGCPPAATASNRRPPPAWTTCRPAPGLQRRTAPMRRPRTSPFISPLLLLLLSFLPPSFCSPLKAGEEAVQSERLSPR